MEPTEVWQVPSGWVVAMVGVPTLGKIIIVWLALRGVDPHDRPKVLWALADLFSWWHRPRRGKSTE